jgi:hypothetical protein
MAAALAIGSFQPLIAAPNGSIDKQLERDFMRNTHNVRTVVPKERSPQEMRFQSNYSDAMAARLGLVDGKARLFRYNLDGSAQNSRTFEGAFGGNGVKFRLNW